MSNKASYIYGRVIEKYLEKKSQCSLSEEGLLQFYFSCGIIIITMRVSDINTQQEKIELHVVF